MNKKISIGVCISLVVIAAAATFAITMVFSKQIYNGIISNISQRSQSFDSADEIPLCPNAGKMVRPDVTLYGELLPENDYEQAIAIIRYADLLIIGGTSLEVGSAAQLAHMYHGENLVIINKGKTKLEGAAELVFHDSIGKILGMISV